eukprot:CFRG3677T1
MERISTYAWCNVILQHCSDAQHSEPVLNECGGDKSQSFLRDVFGEDSIPGPSANVSRMISVYISSAQGLLEKIKPTNKTGRGVYCALTVTAGEGNYKAPSQVTSCSINNNMTEPQFQTLMELDIAQTYHGECIVSMWASSNPSSHPNGSHTTIVPEVPFNSKDKFLGQVKRPVDNLSFAMDANSAKQYQLKGRTDRSTVAGVINVAFSAQVRSTSSTEKSIEYIRTLADAIVRHQSIHGAKRFRNEAAAIFERCTMATGLTRGDSLIILLKNIAIAFPDSSRLLFIAQYAINKLSEKNIDIDDDIPELKKYIQMFATRLEMLLEKYTELDDPESLSAAMKCYADIITLNSTLSLNLAFGVAEESANVMVADLMRRHFLRMTRSICSATVPQTLPQTDQAFTPVELKTYSTLSCLREAADSIRTQVELDNKKFSRTARDVCDVDLLRLAVDGPMREHASQVKEVLRQYDEATRLGPYRTEKGVRPSLELVVEVSAYTDLYFSLVCLLKTTDPLLDEWPYLTRHYMGYHDWFFQTMLAFVKLKCGHGDKWVSNALAQDRQLEFISEGVLHSSSVVDLFGAYSSIMQFVVKLKWNSLENNTHFIEVIAKSIGESLLKYADWLNVQSTQSDTGEVEVDEHAENSSKEIRITPKMCAAMNNIVQSFEQAKLALEPFGPKAIRAVEIAVAAGVRGESISDNEELSQWQTTVIFIFKDVFQSLYMVLMKMVTRLNNQMKLCLGDQIRVILGSKTTVSKSMRVNGIRQLNQTSKKVTDSSKRMAKWLKLRQDKALVNVDVNGNSVPKAGEVTSIMYEEYVAMMSFLDHDVLELLSTYLYNDTFNHIVNSLWKTIVLAILSYVLPSHDDPLASIPSNNFNISVSVKAPGQVFNSSSKQSYQTNPQLQTINIHSSPSLAKKGGGLSSPRESTIGNVRESGSFNRRRAGPSIAQSKWAHQVLQELHDLFYADADGVPLEKLNIPEYKMTVKALKASMLETESLKIRYLMSQTDSGASMKPIQCGPRSLSYNITLQTLSEARTDKIYRRAVVQVGNADNLPDLGKSGTCNAFVQGNLYCMGETPRRLHTFKYTRVVNDCNPQWNEHFVFSIPQNTYGLLLHLSVLHHNQYKSKNAEKKDSPLPMDSFRTTDIYDFDDKDMYSFVGETVMSLDCLVDGNSETVLGDLYPTRNAEAQIILELLRNRTNEKNALRFANARMTVSLGRSNSPVAIDTGSSSISTNHPREGAGSLAVAENQLRRETTKSRSKQHVVQGHVFLARGATVPHTCEVCLKRIVGVGKPLYRCEQCHIHVHKKCHMETHPCSNGVVAPSYSPTRPQRTQRDDVAHILIPKASGKV